MSDLAERLRARAHHHFLNTMTHDLFDQAADRIEALEAALRAIADQDNCLMISEMEEIARAALAPERE